MIKNMLKNSIYAEMWKKDKAFRQDIKTALAILGLGVLFFVYGSIKDCYQKNKTEKESVQTQENKIVKTQNTFNAAHLFNPKQR